ncbi:hypothetical protein SAMN05421823_11839 [Catalinimonas alkaloidigena]|uniref:Uncharacterized protein n=2 Tax=Catalinimonas alkaloidigena TaxID=1075417 RepID=A0A1G9UZL3_9BACT|nr:hypothetical protein SAMN05421823_11839 [Catalinimonas alkaloidigena]
MDRVKIISDIEDYIEGIEEMALSSQNAFAIQQAIIDLRRAYEGETATVRNLFEKDEIARHLEDSYAYMQFFIEDEGDSFFEGGKLKILLALQHLLLLLRLQ